MKLRKILAAGILGCAIALTGLTVTYAEPNVDTGRASGMSEAELNELADYVIGQLETGAKEIDVTFFDVPKSNITNLWTEILYSHPDVYYVNTRISYSYNTATLNVTKIKPNYLEGIDKALFDREYAKMMAVVKPGMSDMEKALAIHDYIVAQCEYDTKANPGDLKCTSFSMYGTVAKKLSVCQGYAGTFMAAMKDLGIECTMIKNATHAWNQVKIDEKWYHVDCTWDDPIGNASGKVYHTYFMKSDEYFLKDAKEKEHTWNAADYVSCTDKSFDDNCAWDNTTNQLVYNEGKWYFTQYDKTSKSEAYYSYDMSTGKVTLVKKLGGKWYAPGSTTTFYPGNTSTASDGKYMYYTTQNSIRVMNYDGTGDKALIRLSNLGDGRIYNLSYVNGTLRYNILSNPSDSKYVYAKTYSPSEVSFIKAGTEAGVTISYGSSKTGITTVSASGNLRMKGTGTTTFSIKSAATALYPATYGSATLQVDKGSLSKASIKGLSTKVYTGKYIKPAVKVYLGGKLIDPKYYTVSYRNNKNTGRATVTVTGRGVLKDTKSSTFVIKPATAKILSVKSSKKGRVTVKYKKSKGSVTGYEIYRATSSKGKYKKVATITKSSTTSKVISAKSRKKYYYKVRAYKKIGNKKVYGNYSKALVKAAK